MNKRIKKKKIQQEIVRHLEEIKSFKVDNNHIFVWEVDINKIDLDTVSNYMYQMGKCLDKMKIKNALVCIPNTTTLNVDYVDFLEHYIEQLEELIKELRLTN